MQLKNIITPIIVGIAIFILLKLIVNYSKYVTEAFGFSDGTLIQLATSHVPTEEDYDELLAQKRQIDHDLIDMTGSA